MISKLKLGKTFYGCCKYVMEKKGAEILYANDIRSSSALEAASDFEAIACLRPNRSTKVVHISVSFASADHVKITNEKMINIGKRLLEEIDLKENQALFVKHNDTNHLHFHIVSNLIKYDGTISSDKFLKNRAAKASDNLEVEFELTVARLQKRENKISYRTTNESINKDLVRQLIERAKENKVKSLKELKEFLKENEVEMFLHKQKTGRINGVSFKKGNHAFKGSALGKKYSYAQLRKEFDNEISHDKEYEK
jgi:hypothetical protein